MMAILDRLAGHPWTEVAGWTLVHFLWQGIALAALAALLLNLMPRSRPASRYAVACGCLLLMAAAPACTAIRMAWKTPSIELNRVADNPISSLLPAIPSSGQPNPGRANAAPFSDPNQLAQSAAVLPTPALPADPATPAPSGWQTGWRNLLTRSFPAGVAVWLAGVLLLSLRLGGGLWRVRQWRRRSVLLQSPEWSGLTARLAARMGLKVRFQLLQSAEAVVPAVIGWLKPAVIVPTSLLSGLTTAELESLLAHELAHIRRHDYLVNLLQTVVETLLFYHPAVWWLSGVIRTEREHCCDDVAVAACGDRMVFVRALTRMEELRCDEPGLALSARGGSLLERIRRMVVPTTQRPTRWPAGVASIASGLTVLTGIVVAALVDGPSRLDPPQPPTDGLDTPAQSALADGPAASNRASGTLSDNASGDSREAAAPADDQEYANHQPEREVVDPVTGQSHPVLAGVRLSQGNRPAVLLDMKYSSLMAYSFIPARIARELGATELGEIDFGGAPLQPAQPQPQPGPWLQLVPPPPGGSPPARPSPPEPPQDSDGEQQVYVDDLSGPAGERQIVPYADPIRIPDHLAFYGINRRQQTKFRVVRIERVDLGLGPHFGPVNALVLDDENTALGVLGSNWARQPRGPKGESFVHSAVDGFWFMALPQESQTAPVDQPAAVVLPLQYRLAEEAAGIIRQRISERSGEKPDGHPDATGVVDPTTSFRVAVDPRTNSLVVSGDPGQLAEISRWIGELDLPGEGPRPQLPLSGVNEKNERVLASHTYPPGQRESTGWLEVDGVQVPVDDGPEAAGTRVHLTPMWDLIAVEASSQRILWRQEWNKLDPAWQKVAILESGTDVNGQPRLIVELESSDGETRKRLDLRTGGVVKSAEPPAPPSPDGFRVIKREEDRITLATVEGRQEGRSPAELLERFAEAMSSIGSPPRAGAWVTDQETLLSAENPSYVLPGPQPDMVFLDAQSILFNLPEGAGIRAELSGENIELTRDDSRTTAVVTNGRVKLVDSQGIVRAEASPDGGAEQLVVEVRENNGERVLQLQTRRLVPSPDYPQPPVQMKCNLATGAPADEEQPPHGAVRFRFENLMGGEPARMKIVWHYDLQRLAAGPAGQAARGTDPGEQTELVPPQATPDDTDWVARARALGNWLEIGSGAGFDARSYLQLAAGLRALPETERIEALRSIASARLEGQTIALCRMLFQAREGADFRRPALGEPHFVGTESPAQNWPLEPIALIEDVPLLVVEGYTLAGLAEPASDYLEWCLANCRWTDRSFMLTEQALANAEQTIRQAEFWRGGIDLDEWRELGLLLKQLRPGFMIHVQQQSWVNQVMPSWMLDFQTRVTPETLVEELRKRGGTPESRMILIISDNATVEWVEQILQPLLAAGYQQVELIRWQQSPEPARIPELQQMLSASRPAAADGEPEWGAIARDSGLQSRLSLQTKSPAVGQPLLFRLELRNTGDQPTRFDPQDYAPFRVLRALGADGQAVPFVGSTPQTSAQPVTLQPGETTVLWQDVDASALFALKEGKHQFFAEGGDWAAQMWWQDSNTLDVELGAGQLPPKQALIRSLAEFELLPEGWQVSATQDEILLSHSPTNLKRDVTTIRLWFTDAPLPDRAAADNDNGREEVTTLAVTTAGHLHVAAPAKTTELWPEYVRDIRMAAARVLVFQTDPPPRQQNGDDGSEAEDRPAADKPWRATGRVVDRAGLPMAGVTVRAHCGFGTLFPTGDTVTDAEGRYDLRFGPGIRSSNPQLVQAATISVSRDGFVEQNLHRQGDRLAALEQPTADDLRRWGRAIEDLFLPGKERNIDFVMVPATRLSGVVTGKDGDRLEGVRVLLTGPELPPSTSLMAETTTDKGGRFELSGLPAGFAFQLLVQSARERPDRLAWASPPIVLATAEDGQIRFSCRVDGREVEVSCTQLELSLSGDGLTRKQALEESLKRPVELSWDGISSDRQVSAGMALLRCYGGQ